ncbi:cellulose synthase family protein [Adhaeribacter soli]|uniref:cellulose synthase family protein n=1 Tax=Adhaeribacter soli TaxID=2607655 RepID=UPI001CD9B4A5|nr:cellulose synthase family protein [Adhaeribacter soli]
MITEGLEILLLLLYGLCLLFIFCYSLLQLNLTVLFLRSRKSAGKAFYPPPAEWPAVTVQLPIYNERFVVERLLEAVTALEFPREKLQIQVLDDSTDETVEIVAQKVAAYQAQGINISQVRRRNREGYKAGALKYGLYQATGEFIAIFDADFVPEPDFLKQTIPAFHKPEIGVVQTRWGHLNEESSLLTRLQAFGLDAHFSIEQSGRNFGGHFINFNGTAGVWRRQCIESAGGWESDTLTEDLDLSYRAQLKGWEFLYLENKVVPAELPADLPALKSQQYRWTKGAAETSRKHFKKLWQASIPAATRWHGLFHLLNSSVFISLFLASLLSLPLLFLQTNSESSAFILRSTGIFLTGFLLLSVYYFVSFRFAQPALPKRVFLFRFPLFLSVSMGLSLHNALAVSQGFLGLKTPFVRTPKYSLTGISGSWKTNPYRLSGLSLITLLEGMLAIAFWFSVFYGLMHEQYRFLFFHGMLAVGYSLVFYYSLRHSFTR